MHDPHLESLLYPLEHAVSLDAAARVLCVGFPGGSSYQQALPKDLTFVQGFRPDFLALSGMGQRVLPEIPNGQFDAIFIRLSRHRGQNEQWIADALRRMPQGAALICAGARTDGAASMRKRLVGLLPGLAHRAMNHGEVFWYRAPENAAELADRLEPKPLEPIDGRFHTAQGMFSAGRIDAGSRLLAAHLPRDLSGQVADFAAGWGYLSAEIAERSPLVTALHLYEADHASLAAARLNVPQREGLRLEFHWHDLVREPVEQRYDAIVTNPPFHVTRRAEPDLGDAILSCAAKALKPHGRLLIVANRQLPYEKVLARHFTRQRLILVQDGYKLLEAWK